MKKGFSIQEKNIYLSHPYVNAHATPDYDTKKRPTIPIIKFQRIMPSPSRNADYSQTSIREDNCNSRTENSARKRTPRVSNEKQFGTPIRYSREATSRSKGKKHIESYLTRVKHDHEVAVKEPLEIEDIILNRKHKK